MEKKTFDVQSALAPASPVAEHHTVASDLPWTQGLTKQEMAAIHLRVPMSGLPWLDEMIRQSRRLDMVEAIVGGLSADPHLRSMPANICTPAARTYADHAMDGMRG